MHRLARLLVLLLAVAAASPLAAQTTDSPAPEAAADTLKGADEPARPRTLDVARPAGGTSAASPEPWRPQLVDWRGEDVVRDERDRMQRYADLAEAEIAATRTRAIQAKATVDVKRSEISALDRRIRDAKKAKLDAERKALETEKKRQELMRDYFERTLEVESARGDLATAQMDYGRSLVRVCDLELQMAGLRPQSERGDDAPLLRAEQGYLESWKVTASAREKVAEREQALADRKLRVIKAWLDFEAGGR